MSLPRRAQPGKVVLRPQSEDDGGDGEEQDEVGLGALEEEEDRHDGRTKDDLSSSVPQVMSAELHAGCNPNLREKICGKARLCH